jgi:RNA polymerase sigma-70 factor, ECF subfamily
VIVDRVSTESSRPTPDEFARALMTDHAPALRRYVGRLLPGDAYRAEDIVQETLLRAWQHYDAVTAQASPRPWLFRVARNLSVDWYRRQAARPAEVEADGVEGPDPQALDRLDDVLRAHMIRDALLPLSMAHRQVLMHLYYFGYSQAEVARLLGVAQGTVKSRAHYAAEQAREALSAAGVKRAG